LLGGACGTVHAALDDMATEAEVAWRAGDWYAARLRECCCAASSIAALACGVYAITGGLGGLGLRGASLLVECSVPRVLLASRSGRVGCIGQGLEAQPDSFRATVRVIVSDVADSADVRRRPSNQGPSLSR
jgi:phthiocerol/phenolphthiocerol synthesis type-I polyketide synthase D